MALKFDVRRKDAAGRLGRVELNGKRVETPLLFPVYNPNKPIIPVDELAGEFNAPALMANAYMLMKNEAVRGEVEERGMHDFLGFDGLIATDSGSYQMMVYGAVETTNAEIIKFQEKIGSDIGSFLDIPTVPDTYKPRAREQLQLTLERSVEAENAAFTVNAAVQGGKYVDLRAEASKAVGGRFELAAIGGIVPLMESYRFAELVEVIAAVKENLPLNTVVHAFGLGHPMLFPLAALLGCDFFDSAAYALYAFNGRYMTDYGTERVEELEHMGCTCPTCREYGVKLKRLYGEDRVRALARHNLYVSYAMVEKVKQAISEGSLWELVCLQARAHPRMMKALDALMGHSGWIAELDPITKPRAFYHTGRESNMRSEVVNARERMKRISTENTVELQPFGQVNEELLDIYPFNSVWSVEDEPKPKVRDIHKLRAIMEYQYGKGAGTLIPDNVIVKKSKNTRRIRWLYEGKEMTASVRATDHLILPKEKLAVKLKEKYETPKLRVILSDDEDATQCVREGKSVMCKFVEEVDSNLRCGDECLIVDKKDNLVRVGTLMLSPKEIKDFNHGMAARVR
ncbi:MAG: tRNA guanosine(15) transglycosylase TgtA [Candidatus Altiarchaeales archaeon]|nr:tRNA guanosine(15) transglycosylase TgtA [Candidatus Altiarchaeales archaeon]MBD3416935.1 tRNA guanosine(15) transglycosylase TgtA [Candidatus Altiarchaeales archaeon]